MKVGFIGLGSLGRPCAECLAEKHEVFGYDIEPRESKVIRITECIKDCVSASEIILIAVPTPHSEEYGGELPSCHLPRRDFDYSVLCEVVTEVSRWLTPRHTVAVISTVLPGTMRERIAPLIHCGTLVYNPYLVAVGTEKEDMKSPELCIIGTSSGQEADASIEVLRRLYAPIVQPETFYSIGTWEEAEATKVFYNTFISMKLAFVNTIQDVVERIGHCNVDRITSSLARGKKRITSPAYFTAGLGDGGPCHPRDNIALGHLAEKLGLGYDLFGAISEAREVQAKNLAHRVASLGRPVIILGKTFKPNVSSVAGSYSLLVAHYIEELGLETFFVDPYSGDNAVPTPDRLWTFLVAHRADWVWDYTVPDRAVVVDPWRKYVSSNSTVTVVHYGHPRPTPRI